MFFVAFVWSFKFPITLDSELGNALLFVENLVLTNQSQQARSGTVVRKD